MSTALIPGVVPTITLPQRLRIAREHAGLEQLALAKVSGVSRATISAAENGRTTPSRATISLIAFACGVSREWLATGQVNENPDPDGPGGELLRLDSNQQPSGYRPSDNVIYLLPSRPSWENTENLPSIA